MSISLDGNVKLNHIAKCGVASASLEPRLHAHYGSAQQEVRDLAASGKLDLKSFIGGATDSAVDQDDCATSIHCSRPDASNSQSVCDVYGVCGGVCAHTIPVRGSFVDMCTPEQFVYYLVILLSLLNLGVQVKDVFIDFACRLMKTWQRYLANHPSVAQQLAGAAGLRILVNWMHGNSHDIACQLKHCGRFTHAAAHRDGENTERLWALMKVCATLFCHRSHYMRDPHPMI